MTRSTNSAVNNYNNGRVGKNLNKRPNQIPTPNNEYADQEESYVQNQNGDKKFVYDLPNTFPFFEGPLPSNNNGSV